MDNYPDTFAFVQIHAGSDGYDTAWGNARKTFYGVTGYPTTVFDGVLKHSGSHTYAIYQSEFLSRPDTTDVTIALTGDLVSGQTYSAQAEVCIEPGGTGKTMRIYMVQVLDHWPLPSDTPAGSSYSRNGFKQAADAHGSEPDITLAPGECQTIVREFTFDARSWASQDDIKIIAWAQAPGSPWPKEAYQAAVMGWPFPPSVALTIELPDGVPEYIPPDESTDITVQIEDGSETYVPDSGTLHYRYDGGTFLTSLLTPLGGDLYAATLPAPACDDTPEFYISAEGDEGTVIYNPEDAPTSYYSTGVATVTEIFSDDFEADLGWTVENDPTLTDGAWERAIPGMDVDRGAPPEDYDGSGYCYVTDNDYRDDVDGGPTRVISPTVDVSGASNPILRFAYWWSSDDQDGDPFDVDISNDDGATWIPVLSFIDIGYPIESWSVQDIDIATAIDPEPLTATMRFRFSATDPAASIAEGGLDAVRVFNVECGAQPFCATLPNPAVCFADTNGDGNVNTVDTGLIEAAYGLTDQESLCKFDVNCSGTINTIDVGLTEAAYGVCTPASADPCWVVE